MASPTRKIVHVDFDIRFPFYTQPIRSKDLRYLPAERALWARTPDGVISFTQSDDLHFWYRDYNLPLDLQQSMTSEDWQYVSMADFILEVHLEFLREQ